MIVAGDTLPPQIEALKAGRSHAQVGQRPFEMGYRAPVGDDRPDRRQDGRARSSTPGSTSARRKTSTPASESENGHRCRPRTAAGSRRHKTGEVDASAGTDIRKPCRARGRSGHPEDRARHLAAAGRALRRDRRGGAARGLRPCRHAQGYANEESSARALRHRVCRAAASSSPPRCGRTAWPRVTFSARSTKACRSCACREIDLLLLPLAQSRKCPLAARSVRSTR